jgi:hypothetical protein
MSLNNFAIALYQRFRTLGDSADIDECIQLHGQAIALRPHPHPDRAGSLNLANAVHERYKLRGGSPDIHEAIQLHAMLSYLRICSRA